MAVMWSSFKYERLSWRSAPDGHYGYGSKCCAVLTVIERKKGNWILNGGFFTLFIISVHFPFFSCLFHFLLLPKSFILPLALNSFFYPPALLIPVSSLSALSSHKWSLIASNGDELIFAWNKSIEDCLFFFLPVHRGVWCRQAVLIKLTGHHDRCYWRNKDNYKYTDGKTWAFRRRAQEGKGHTFAVVCSQFVPIFTVWVLKHLLDTLSLPSHILLFFLSPLLSVSARFLLS